MVLVRTIRSSRARATASGSGAAALAGARGPLGAGTRMMAGPVGRTRESVSVRSWAGTGAGALARPMSTWTRVGAIRRARTLPMPRGR
jgi:hypothetical protein